MKKEKQEAIAAKCVCIRSDMREIRNLMISFLFDFRIEKFSIVAIILSQKLFRKFTKLIQVGALDRNWMMLMHVKYVLTSYRMLNKNYFIIKNTLKNCKKCARIQVRIFFLYDNWCCNMLGYIIK